MSAPAFFKKEIGGLRPVGEIAKEVMRKLKLGATVQVEVRRPRNLMHHKKFWALMQLVSDNLDNVPADTLCQVVKLRTGYVDVVRTKRGEVQIPRSISFASMDQAEFEAFYDKAVAFICSDILPGIGKDDLLAEVESVIEGRAA